MTTYDASLDYWSEDSTWRASGRSQSEAGSEFEDYGLDEPSLRDLRRESRNHFIGFVLLNLLFWPILVYAGLLFSESHSPLATKTIAVSDGQSITADQLISAVTARGRSVFWLNGISGDTYSENSSVSGLDVISYIPASTNLSTPRSFDLVIKTYRDTNFFNSQLHPLSGADDAAIEKVGGVTITYSPSSPDHSVVTFKDRPQVVTIDYPSFQGLSTLVADAENLQLISPPKRASAK